MKRDGSDGRCVKNYKNTEHRLTLPASSQEKLKKKKKCTQLSKYHLGINIISPLVQGVYHPLYFQSNMHI